MSVCENVLPDDPSKSACTEERPMFRKRGSICVTDQYKLLVFGVQLTCLLIGPKFWKVRIV